MAENVTRRGGDYVLALKGNQPGLRTAAAALVPKARTPAAAVATTQEHAHGREETRTARVVAAPGLGRKHGFVGLAAIGEVHRTRIVKGKLQQENWLYIMSRRMSSDELLSVVRGHWDIENGLHWGLDVVYREDECRTRSPSGQVVR